MNRRRNGKQKYEGVKLPPIKGGFYNKKPLHSGPEQLLQIPIEDSAITPEKTSFAQKTHYGELTLKLNQKREHAKHVLVSLNEQWGNLERLEKSLQQTVLLHNSFVRRNMEKRERAIAKMASDQESFRRKEEDIAAMKRHIDRFKEASSAMRTDIKKLRIYEEYLMSVIEYYESPFMSTMDFIVRYEYLSDIKQLCMQYQNKKMREAVELGTEFEHFYRINKIKISGMRNELENMSSRFEEAQRRSSYGDYIVSQIRNKCGNLQQEADTAYHIIDDVVKFIYRRKREKLPTMPNMEMRIDVIKETLELWQKLKSKYETKDEKKSNEESKESESSFNNPNFEQ